MTKCTKCHSDQEEFYKENGKTMSICKTCRNLITRKSKQKNREKKLSYDREHSRAYYELNKEAHNARTKAYQVSPKGRFGAAKALALHHKRVWTITLEEFTTMYLGTCFVKGCTDRVTGLDRIDSSTDYINDNVRPSCYRHNIMKNDMTDEQCYLKMKEFIIWYESLHTKC